MALNAENYRLAAERVASGRWVVDPRAGVVLNAASGALLGTPADGYRVINLSHEGGSRRVRAHRVIWESVHGPVPEGLEINHINPVRHDNRISNLEAVTRSQNIAHGHRAGNVKPPRRTHGKLTAAQVAEMQRLLSVGWTRRRLSSHFKVSLPTVRKALRPTYQPNPKVAP